MVVGLRLPYYRELAASLQDLPPSSVANHPLICTTTLLAIKNGAVYKLLGLKDGSRSSRSQSKFSRSWFEVDVFLSMMDYADSLKIQFSLVASSHDI